METTQQVTLTIKSNNKKIGKIPCTTTERSSCPDACPWKNNGCYAEGGRVAFHWLQGKQKKISWEELCENVSSFKEGQLWRHNVAGDLPGNLNKIDHSLLAKLVEANRGRLGFTYTHKPVGEKGQALVNARAIYAANKSGFTINLSADCLSEADELFDLGIGPVVTVLPSDAPQVSKTSKGRRVIACPAETKDITCSTCKLCQKRDRKTIIGFRAHGNRKNLVNKRLQVIQ